MSDTIDQSAVSTAAKRHGSSRRHPFLVWLAVVWLGVMIVAGIGADILSPHDYRDLDLRNRLLPPLFFGGQLSHPLGTDQLGHDVFSRLLHSIRMSFLVALIGTVIGAALGTILGFIAAHRRGIADDVITMFVDFQAAMPFTIIALTVLAFFGNDLMLFIAVMGIYGWERYARLARGLALSARKQGYALALDTLGAGPWRIYSRHILPNIGSVLIVNMTINFPETILAESALSFLGLGIQPPLTSLGNMLGYGRDYLTTAWWIVVFPGLTIVFSVLAMSLLGDWLRDRLDPRISAN